MDIPTQKPSVSDLCREIKRLLTIEEVVKYYITIKKKGKYYICCCPFHKERTPSFFINSSLGFFKCFGCGAAGDIFSFVEKYENISFIEAVALFAERYPLVTSICHLLLGEKSENEDSFCEKRKSCEFLKRVQDFFVTSLFEKPLSAEALGFIKKRGVDAAKAKTFGIGFCPPGSFFFENNFSKDEVEIMDELGLVHKGNFKNKKILFENRISFPFFDSLGNVVGFSWRCLESPGEKRSIPKYINSSESFIFKKREVLFGSLQARAKIRETRKCFLVEGFFDVIAMFCVGYENTVAVSGTALSSRQCFLLKKTADCVSLFFDNDGAGEAATIRAIQQCLGEGFMVNVVRIKGKEKDPDEFLRGKNPEKATCEIKNLEEDFVSFLYRFFSRESGGMSEKTRAVNKVLSFLELIKDRVYKTLALKKLSSLCGVDFSLLNRGCSAGKSSATAYENDKKEKKSTVEGYEDEVLFLLFKGLFFLGGEENLGDLERIVDIIGDGSFFSEGKKEIVFLFLNSFKKNGKIEPEVLNEIKDEALKERIISVFFEGKKREEACGKERGLDLEEVKVERGTPYSLLRLLYENVLFLKIKKIQESIVKKREMLKQCAEEETNTILDEIEKLKQQEREISKQLKIRVF